MEAFPLIEKAEKTKADFIEVRLDSLETSRNLQEVVKATNIPLIATNKLHSEHGFFAGTETERQLTLLNAAKAGFQYVDIDICSPLYQETIGKVKLLGSKTIASYHKYEGALDASEMDKVLGQQISSGATVFKIVTMARKIEDNLTALDFVAAKASQLKLVCFCMGEQGKISRLMSPLFGAFFTFASLESGSQTALGQMTAEEMRLAYSLLGAK